MTHAEAPAAGVLAGIRVLDFGRYVAGPYAAAVLGDLGAEVIRIEPPEGASDRYAMPLADGVEGANFVLSARNKRSLALDISSVEGRAVLARLIAGTDVVVANMPPRQLSRAGIDYGSLKQHRPDIILAIATAFGTTGPYSERLGFDAIAQCQSGAVHLSGDPEQPMRVQAAYCDYGTALYLAVGVLGALLERARSGRGQQVEASLLHTGLAFVGHFLVEQAVLGTQRARAGNRGQTGGPIDLFRTRDGWVMIFAFGDAQFRRLAQALGRPEWLDDPRFVTDTARGQHGAVLSAEVAAWCATRTSAEVLDTMADAHVPCGPLLSSAEVLADPQVNAAGLLKRVGFPGLPEAPPLVDLPLRMSVSPTGIRHRAPTLGEDNDAILREFGFSVGEIESFRSKGLIRA